MKSPSRNTSVVLGEHFTRFVREQIESGRYGSASEVIRAGLRILEEQEAKLSSLRAALEEGERSGFATDYSIERILTKVRRGSR